MRETRMFLLTFLVILPSCTIDDEDRCLDGYTWEEKSLACRKDTPESTSPEPDATTDLEQDSSEDDGADTGVDTEADNTTLPEGLGDPCTAGGNECDAFEEANHCALDPRDTSAPGFCTINECKPGGCPPPYSCCNCFDAIIYCMSEEDATRAVTSGCTCS